MDLKAALALLLALVSAAGCSPALVTRRAEPVAARSAELPARSWRERLGDGATLARWSVDLGTAFPGARAAAAVVATSDGDVARLSYDFRAGGHWVALRRQLRPALAATVARVRVRAPPGIRVVLQVIDSEGQILQYGAPRPFAALEGDAPFTISFALDAPSGRWKGARDGRIHGGIASLAILAADPLRACVQGSVDVASVELVDGDDSAVVEPAAIVPARGETALGINIGGDEDDAALALAADAGFGLARCDLVWASVEQQRGAYDFGRYERLQRQLAAHGLETLFILDYANPLYETGPPRSDEAVAAYAAFAQQAARTFAGLPVRFEVWNEPNLARFWPPRPDAHAYATLAAAAIAAMTAAVPEVRVAVGSTSEIDYPFLDAMARQGAAEHAAAVSVHPYRDGAPETFADDVRLLRATVARAGERQLWASEAGYRSAERGEDRQALLAVRQLLTARALALPVAVYYSLRDADSDPRGAETYGLLTHDGRPKRAIEALLALARSTRGRRFAGVVPVERAGVHALRFDGDDDALLIVWTTSAHARVRVASALSVRDLAGRERAPAGVLALDESDGPLYVTIARR